MEWFRLFVQLVGLVIWPAAAITIALKYRKILAALAPGAEITPTIAEVTIKTTLREVERFVSDSLRGKPLSRAQWNWLRQLRDGRMPFEKTELGHLRPLRDAGLIRGHPEGFLQDAAEVELTQLGTL